MERRGAPTASKKRNRFPSRIGLILFLCFAGMWCHAQDRFSEAKKEMQVFNYAKAVTLLIPETTRGSVQSKHEAGLLLADCYRMMNDAANAAKWYGEVLEKTAPADRKSIVPDMWFRYAQSLRTCGNYAKAKLAFLRYDSLNPSDPGGLSVAALCDSALVWQKAKPGYRISNLSQVNSPQSEFGVVFYRNGILFASDRTRDGENGKTYGWTGNNYLGIWFAGKEGRDSLGEIFGNPHPAKEIADQPWHDGPVCFSRDLTEMFITRTQAADDKAKKEPGRLRTHLLKLFTSKFENGKWSAPEPFFLNSDQYSVGHPALSRGGDTLFFVSDMPGGYGETDLYSCTRVNGKWSNAVNLGPKVNTQGKEMFPFVAANGILWFTSDGLPGFGGLDIFITRKEGDTWSIPQNPGQPVNSSYDDFSVAVDSSGFTGLFSSNRTGGAGSDDIYRFAKILPPPPPEIVSAPRIIGDTLVPDKPYRIENIFYDFDKWNIRNDAKPPLDRLVRLMKEYPFSIELGSHTDCRGSDAYNQVLSQRRAESAVKYIISKGIDPGRITAKGYGESQPAVKCSCSKGNECSEAEHQYNRRTEFRIIKR